MHLRATGLLARQPSGPRPPCVRARQVFKDKAGRLRSFRLDQNVARLSRSMARSGMPALTAADQTALVDLIHSLVRVDKNFVRGRWVVPCTIAANLKISWM